MTKLLENKLALVTGGTTGIGLASVKRLAQEGATVVATGRNPETLAKAQAELGSSVDVVASDASDPEAINKLIADVSSKHGKIDVLFLNAGIALFAPLEQAPVDQFDKMWSINVRGPWLALQAALPHLNDGASVIFTTSVVNEMGMPGASAYAATKAALREIVRVAAAELAPRKIRVNAVSPGPIETPIFSKTGMSKEEMDGFAQNIAAQIPLARFGQSDEIASAVAFLASSESAFITGAELPVDGGLAQV